MTLKHIAMMCLGFAMSPAQRDIVAREAQHQEDMIKVRAVLPGKYPYEQVEAAINAAGTHPRAIYESLAANQHTPALARFYEALNGPQEGAR